jgi:hypothetical protein
MGSPANIESNRERIRHRPASNHTHEGRTVAEDGEDHGFCAYSGGFENVAQGLITYSLR